jgi:hypothetical protein
LNSSKLFNPTTSILWEKTTASSTVSFKNYGNKHKFISIGRGLHAQQSKDTETPPSPGEHHITLAERELYREETCQYCGVVGYIAKICWWVPK